MKSFNLLFIILIVFFKTGNVLSQNNLFNVNNIEVEKNSSTSNEILANKAIQKGFNELINKILLERDIKKIKKLNKSEIKELVLYYQIIDIEDNNKENIQTFNIFFDRDKIHNLFLINGILYSEIYNNDLFLLPILKKNDRIFIYTNNYFYKKWNSLKENKLIEFILPLENIETIQQINSNKNDLLSLDIRDIFQEYTNKNIALIFIEDTNSNKEKVFLKTRIMGKTLNRNLVIEKMNLTDEEFYNKIILDTKNEIINLVKEQNLIDVSTPSFINTIFKLSKKNNFVELNRRIKKIELIDNVFVQEFNNEYIFLRIKYLGKIDKIINQLNEQNIILKFKGEQWSLKII